MADTENLGPANGLMLLAYDPKVGAWQRFFFAWKMNSGIEYGTFEYARSSRWLEQSVMYQAAAAYKNLGGGSFYLIRVVADANGVCNRTLVGSDDGDGSESRWCGPAYSHELWLKMIGMAVEQKDPS